MFVQLDPFQNPISPEGPAVYTALLFRPHILFTEIGRQAVAVWVVPFILAICEPDAIIMSVGENAQMEYAGYALVYACPQKA